MYTKQPSGRTLIALLTLLGGVGGLDVTSGCVGPPTMTLSIQPAQPSLPVGASQTFTATLAGHPDGRVTWSTSGGFITPEGVYTVYTAPTRPGPYSVTATSVALLGLSATTTVTSGRTPLSTSPLRGASSPRAAPRPSSPS